MLPIPNRSQNAPAMPPPPRPQSPTFLRLLSLAEQEQKGRMVIPGQPAQVRRATVEEWGAVQTFVANMEEADPACRLRKNGEFFQTFTSKPEEMDYVSNHPIRYNSGDRVAPPQPSDFPPRTSEMVHSHPPSEPGTTNAFPSAQDYLGTYLINNGNEKGIGSILYHVGTGHAYAFAGKVNPETNQPEFHRITQPSLRDNMEWMQKHGYGEPPKPPAPPRGEGAGRSPSPELMFPMDDI